MILRTERLTLRPLTAADTEDLHGLMSDAETMAFWDVPQINDIDVTRAIVAAQVLDIDLGRAVHWTVIDRATDAVLGCCDLSEIDLWHQRAEVGYLIARSAWGAGIAFEAMAAVLDHAASRLRFQRLTARVHAGNERSVRLLERLGFEKEGLLRGYIVRAGERRDCLVFGLLI